MTVDDGSTHFITLNFAIPFIAVEDTIFFDALDNDNATPFDNDNATPFVQKEIIFVCALFYDCETDFEILPSCNL